MTFVADGSFLESSSDSLIWLILLLRIGAAAVAEGCWKAAQLSHQIFYYIGFVNVFSTCPAEGAPHLHHKEAIDLGDKELFPVGMMDIGWIQCFSAELLHFCIIAENVPHLLKSLNIEPKIHAVSSGGGFCLGVQASHPSPSASLEFLQGALKAT